MEFDKDYEHFIIVKESSIHGKGIFSKGFIPKGSLVMVIKGEAISEKECLRRENEEDNVYIFWNGDNYIDTAMTDKIKYINHNCDPNCEVFDRDEESLNLVAAKDILPGDEITIDYDYEEIYEECTCSKCRPELKVSSL